MLTPRDREIRRLCEQRDARRVLAAAFACGAIGLAAAALLWPEPAAVLWMLAAADAALAFRIGSAARAKTRRIEELTWYVPKDQR